MCTCVFVCLRDKGAEVLTHGSQSVRGAGDTKTPHCGRANILWGASSQEAAGWLSKIQFHLTQAREMATLTGSEQRTSDLASKALMGNMLSTRTRHSNGTVRLCHRQTHRSLHSKAQRTVQYRTTAQLTSHSRTSTTTTPSCTSTQILTSTPSMAG